MENILALHMINGIDLLKWFYLGAQEVQSNKKYLNSINLFPVADGDTGTNLSTTMKAMIDHTQKDQAFHKVIHSMSESGLAHARGNSGILFASYIKGLAIEANLYDEVTIKDFSNIAHKAVKYLYAAIDNPVEGTMISVIKDWAAFLYFNHEKYDSFSALLQEAYRMAGISLQKTTKQLEVLRRNRVVDSGAEGFVRFLNGINRYFTGAEIELSTPWISSEIAITEERDSHYTYCTEFFLELSKRYEKEPNHMLERRIKTVLRKLGDSLIVTSQGNKLKVHIHTDHPEAVADTLKFYGTFLEQKADNMKLQTSIRTHRQNQTAIVTDSIADLPEEYKLEHQIHTLPLGLLIEDSVYLDKLTIKPRQLFTSIPKLSSYPTSTQPEPGRIRVFLESLLDFYDSIIFITVSSLLSGTYQTAAAVARELSGNGKNIAVIDSRLNSGAQGLLVMTAAKLLEAGSTLEDTVKKLELAISDTRIYVCLNTLEYAVRSGRIANTVGKLGMKLGLRPIMTLDAAGRGSAFGAALSKKGSTKQIFRQIKKNLKEGGIKHYSIVHADNLTLALEYEHELKGLIGKSPEFITEISSIVAIHSGPGSVAICFTKE